MCACACVCVCVCLRMLVCVHACVCLHARTCVFVSACVRICECVFALMRVCALMCVCVQAQYVMARLVPETRAHMSDEQESDLCTDLTGGVRDSAVALWRSARIRSLMKQPQYQVRSELHGCSVWRCSGADLCSHSFISSLSPSGFHMSFMFSGAETH